MLTMTPDAATALVAVRSEHGAPATYGVRFFTEATDASERARLAFDFVETPQPDDTITFEGDLKAYIAPEVDQLIGDAIVDVDATSQRPGLVVRRSSRDREP